MIDLKDYYEKASEKYNTAESKSKRDDVKQQALERIRDVCRKYADETIERIPREAKRRADQGSLNDEYYASLWFEDTNYTSGEKIKKFSYDDTEHFSNYEICSTYVEILRNKLYLSGIQNAKVHVDWRFRWIVWASPNYCHATIKVKKWGLW